MNKLRITTLAFVLALPPLLQGCLPLMAAGAGAGVMVATDRRTSGTYLEDEGIEVRAGSRISDKYKDRVHVNLTSFNRTVLLTGEAPTAEIRADVEKLVGEVPNVRSVANEVQIAGTSSLTARGNDSFITSKVKARFVDIGKFSANHVKVVTEAGTVYLLGLVTRQEADDAVEIARTTGGVAKVVKLFEYVAIAPTTAPAAAAPAK
jgi:osmotically-inducible protein OsmY